MTKNREWLGNKFSLLEKIAGTWFVLALAWGLKDMANQSDIQKWIVATSLFGAAGLFAVACVFHEKKVKEQDALRRLNAMFRPLDCGEYGDTPTRRKTFSLKKLKQARACLIPIALLGLLGGLFEVELWGNKLLITLAFLFVVFCVWIFIQAMIDRHPGEWRRET